MTASLLAFIAALAFASFFWGRRRAASVFVRDTKGSAITARPHHAGFYVALWCGLPALMLVFLGDILAGWMARRETLDALGGLGLGDSDGALQLYLQQVISAAESGDFSPLEAALIPIAQSYQSLTTLSSWAVVVVALAAAVLAAALAYRRIAPKFRARDRVEKIIIGLMALAATVAILTTVGIVCSLLFETLRFFQRVPVTDFLFGLSWSPQTAIREDQVGSSGAFGAVPVFAGTLLITVIAMLVAVPLGLFSAIYLSEFAGPKTRATVKPLLEILAGVPTVVYGFFAALTLGPNLRVLGESLGIPIVSESALAAGLIMGVMILPFVSSLSDDVINAVPQTLRDGSLAMGATEAETICKVVLPAALPGIAGSVLLAVSRAIGETMIVVMAAGLAANLTANPFEAVTTVTVQIVTLLVGDQAFDSAKTLSAFALGLMLFVITLALNLIALHIVRRYREIYD